MGNALFLLPALIPISLFTLWPLTETIRLSLYQWDGFGPQTFVGLGNLQSLLGDDTFRTALAHSVEWIAAAGILATALALGIALLLRAVRGGTAALGVLIFPALLPATVVASICLLVLSPTSGLFTVIFNDLGQGSHVPAPLGDPGEVLPALFLAWLWSSIGIGTLLFWAGLRAIGREFHEVAIAEGAGPWWRFVHVTLPACRRSINVVVLINAALAGQVFDLVYVTTGGGPGYASLILPLDVYSRAFGGKTGQGAAAAVTQIGIVLLLAGAAMISLRGHHEYATGEPDYDSSGRRKPLMVVPAALVALLSLLPILWLLRAVALPGRALTLGNAGPSFAAVSDNLRAAWDTGLGGALLRSLIIALCVVAATVVLAAPAGYALAAEVRSRVVRITVLGALFLAVLEPAPVLIIPLFSLLRSGGLLDSPLGILLPEIARALPLTMLALWAALSGLAREPLEAARVDGASPRQTMMHVALPIARPAVVVGAVWAFIVSWNEYLLPTVVSQDGSLSTVPTVLGGFAGAYDTQFGALAAGAALSLLPALALFVILRWSAVGGLARLGRQLP